MDDLHVDALRIKKRLAFLATFGFNEQGGIDRNFGSPADLQVREVLLRQLREEVKAETHVDAAANIWGLVNTTASLPFIAVGSHHDSVVNGGRYDGAMGIVLAMEVLQVLQESERQLRHPLALVSFTAEEPNPFDLSTFGSRSAAGKLKKELVRSARNAVSGQTLSEALQLAGGDLDKLPEAKLKPEAFSAFIECHIEQGKRLEKCALPLAVVSGITGIYRETIRICGEANHAGTTVMADRHDALAAASAFCLAFEGVLKNVGRDDVVGTIGRFSILPNAVNIIPSEVSLTLELRAPNQTLVEQVLTGLNEQVESIENARGVKIKRELLLDQAAVAMNKVVMKAMSNAVEMEQEKSLTLTSMAGHDATHMAGLTKAGMLFVRSIDGKSHCPEEESRLADIEKAGNVLLQTILALDKELD